MKRFLVVLFCLAFLVGCVTVTYPDGTVETRVDPNLMLYAETTVQLAITAYNAYRTITAETEAPENPSRICELLDNVERALAQANAIRELAGLAPLSLGEESGVLLLKGTGDD